jgi:hypothetical protein
VAVAAWLLLLCATTLLTGGALYGDTVALGGLRTAIAEAPFADRSLVVTSEEPASQVGPLDRAIRAELDRAIALPGGIVALVASSPPFADAATDPADVRTLTRFSSFEDVAEHATLSSGRWASPGATPQEATLSAAAAAILKLRTGDHITLLSRLEPVTRIEVLVTGTWQPNRDDPYWLNDPLALDGSVVQGSYTVAGPFVVPDADLAARPFGARISYEWRGLADPTGFRLGDVAAIRASAEALETRIKLALPNRQFSVATGLPKILTAVERSVLVSRTGVLLLVIQYAVLALYAIVLVAGMLSDRRRAETALFRTRGASTAHLAAMGVLESVVLTGSAALVAPFAALLAVRALVASQPLDGSVTSVASISWDALVVDGLTAAVGVIALSLPLLQGAPNLAGVRAAIARQTNRTLARRLGLDLALVVVAAIALWQLRQYGAPLTRNARGLLGIDPLLVAAPAIGLLAGAVLATRLLPRALEVAEGVLERGRGLVAPMGGRGLARRPLRYTRSALLLMLAASLGTFAVANVATWTRSQGDQAAYQAGADLRMSPSSKAGPAWTIGSELASIDTVRAVMPVDRLSVDAGRSVRGQPLLAIDTAAAASIVNRTPGVDEASLAGLYRELAAARPRAVGAEVPDGTVALALLLDAGFVGVFEDPNQPIIDLTAYPGIGVSVVVQDGLGRYYRLGAPASAFLSGPGQRIVADLRGAAGSATLPVSPIRVLGMEVTVAAPAGVSMTGTVTLREIDATADPAADPAAESAWHPIDLTPTTPGWSRSVGFGNSASQKLDPSETPWQLDFNQNSELPPIFGGFTSQIAVDFSADGSDVPVTAIASTGFLEATGAKVGDTLPASLEGVRASVRLVGQTESFPTLDPAKPFLIADERTLAAARFFGGGGSQPPTEWWVAASDPAGVERAIQAGVDPGATVVTAADRQAALLADPIPRGVIGVLGLGSWAALIFAAIGFVVSATVSTRERLGEFALLRALGLSGRQLSLWLALEHTFLLVAGILAGLGLGALLAWLVLPFATLTATGAAVTPPPVVVIPAASLLPIAAGAVGVLLATLIVLRQQLLAIRIGDVLRGQDE